MLLENIQAVVVLQVARCLASNTHPNVVGSFAERHERRDVEFAGEVTKEIVRPPFKKGGVGFVDRCRTSPVVCWANDSGAASFVARCRPVDKRGRRLPQKLCSREAESCFWTCDVPLGFRLLTAVRPYKTVVDGEPRVSRHGWQHSSRQVVDDCIFRHNTLQKNGRFGTDFSLIFVNMYLGCLGFGVENVDNPKGGTKFCSGAHLLPKKTKSRKKTKVQRKVGAKIDLFFPDGKGRGFRSKSRQNRSTGASPSLRPIIAVPTFVWKPVQNHPEPQSTKRQ